MNRHRLAAYATVLLLAGLAACDSSSAPTPVADQPGSNAATLKSSLSRHLFTFRAAIPDGFTRRVQALGGKIALKDEVLRAAAVSGLTDREAQDLVRDGLAQAAEVEPVLQLHPYGVQKPMRPLPGRVTSPSNPADALLFLPLQWNMTAVHADAAWAAGKLGSSDTEVAILDTGLDYTHPDLAGHVDLARSIDLVGETDSIVKYVGAGWHPITDLNTHGTHVGAVVSSNAFITAGITSRTTLMGVKVCTMRGRCPVFGVLEGIRYAADAGASVINLSIAVTFSKSSNPGLVSLFNTVMGYAQRKGALVVVSAGNSASDLDHDGNMFAAYCSAPHVICVSALGPTGVGAFGPFVNVDAFASSFSNFGRSAITVAAPGGNVVIAGGAVVGLTPVWSSCSTTAQDFGSLLPGLTDPSLGLLCPPQIPPVVGLVGTSQAAPHVAGLAASLAAEGVRGASQLRAAILKGADDLGPRGTDPFFGRGRIDVAASLGVN